MYKAGRNILGWIAVLAALVAVLTLLSGLVFPPGLQAVEKVICPSGTTIVTSRNSLTANRNSTDKSYSQFCSAPYKSDADLGRLADVTTRWFFLIGGALVLAALCLMLRSRLTPPLLRAPTV